MTDQTQTRRQWPWVVLGYLLLTAAWAFGVGHFLLYGGIVQFIHGLQANPDNATDIAVGIVRVVSLAVVVPVLLMVGTVFTALAMGRPVRRGLRRTRV